MPTALLARCGRWWRALRGGRHRPAGWTGPAGCRKGEGESLIAVCPAISTRADPALVKALARAFRYQRMLDEGRYSSITEMAEAEKLDRGYMGRLLQLTLLAPRLVEAVIDGRQPQDVTLPSLLKPFPAEWARHRVD
jgi:hypothetical protein